MFIITGVVFLEIVILHLENIYIGHSKNIIMNIIVHMECILIHVFVVSALSGS